jgi:ribosomal protein S18 acetylase RimI-like enzyme
MRAITREPTMSDVIIRTATDADADTIAGNNVAMALETERRRLDPATVRAGVRRVLADPARGVYYVAQREGKVVGQLLITREWSDWRDGWFWWIQSVYVVPEARREGVYRRLYQHVVSEAHRQPDVRGLRLYADTENTRAQRVYESLGMQRARYHIYELDWTGQK